MKTKSGADSKALLQLFSNRLVEAIDNKAKKVEAIEIDSDKVDPGALPRKNLVSSKLRKLPPSRKVIMLIAPNWNRLRELTLTNEVTTKCYRGYSADDVLIETFEFLIRDEKAKKASEEEIIEMFCAQFKMLMWRAKMDAVTEKQILYGKTKLDGSRGCEGDGVD